MRAGETQGADAALALDAASRDRLRAARAALEDAAVALVASRRPDWGEALLLAAARLVAIDESLAAGRLVTLDALPADARLLRVSKRRRALAPALLAEAREDLEPSARAFLFQQRLPRSGVERARGGGESRRGTAWGRGRRARAARRDRFAAAGRARAGRRRTAARGDAGRTPRALGAARDAERSQRRALEAQYRYDLVARNCVSELFRTVEAGLAAQQGAPAAADRAAVLAFVARESERRLGGYVASRGARELHPVRVVAQRASALGGRAAHPSAFGARARSWRARARCVPRCASRTC